jgi:hypothetical protein
MNKRFAAVLFVLGLLLVRTMSSAAETKPEVVAQEAAKKWLALVDAGKSEESWQEMSAPFKKEVSKRKWKSTIGEIRKSPGKVVSRKLKSAEYTKELPGAPEGEYVVAKFDTAFEHKPAAVETATLVLGQDLIWRVSSYAVK